MVASGHSTAEAAQLLGVAEGTVRTWVRAGIVDPERDARGSMRFSFQDIVVLRTAAALLQQGLTAARVKTALSRLRDELPSDRSLASVRVYADGGRVIVQEGGEEWDPATGQLRFAFAVPGGPDFADSAAGNVASFASAPDATAEEWFELALEAEASGDAGKALEAYARVLELEPSHPGACLNRGTLLHERGDLAGAEEHFRRAVELVEDDVTGWFNLGVVLQDQRRHREAIEAYAGAIRADPRCADAYFNLAAIYEELGESAIAIQNLKIYRKLVRG